MLEWFKIFNTRQDAENRIALNDKILVVLKGRRLCLARTPVGFYAIDDSCPHLGESLSKGHLNYLGEITCPWHSYRYDLKTGLECQNRSNGVEVHQVRIDANGLFIGILTNKN
jgi:nitrite reductase/ring-hydroxylating ferredoxin subunit